ncbi:MAG: DUF2577 family protein [Acutalibacteraceae bacterium]
MNAYEKILKIMNKEGAKSNEKGVFLATVGENLSIDAGTLTLEKEDLLIAQPLLTGYTAADGSVISPIKKGDYVLIKRLSGEKYAVLEKVIDQE